MPRQPLARQALLAALVAAVGAAAIVRADIATRRAQFQAEARTAYRVLSQATARLDAVLATLDLMPPADSTTATTAAVAAKLPTLYPQVLAATHRAEPSTPASGRAPVPPVAVESVDAGAARYTLALQRADSAWTLRIDARRLAAADEWPWPTGDAVRATLALGGQFIVLQDVAAHTPRPLGLTEGFEFRQPLASASQPFVLHAQRFTGPAQWPWAALAGWLALCAAGWWAAQRWRQTRAERRRAAEHLRLAQASRLSTLGELAAGVAHELNQPLTATLAGTQTALRLLREGAPGDDDTRTAVQALELAGAQARRAADVVGRLRSLVQRQGTPTVPQPTDLREVARRIVHLLAPELARATVQVRIDGPPVQALADPVAVEQILHNLLVNAIQALQAMQRLPSPPEGGRQVVITLGAEGGRGRCSVRDNGPGFTEAQQSRVFAPFNTTREGGLGLGLPLCQTLAMSMDGHLALISPPGAGAEFVLDLPRVGTAPGAA
jgi:signal transduction histidine kinase